MLHLFGTDASYSLWRAAIASVAGRGRRSSAPEPEIASRELGLKSQSLREQLDRHGISLIISQRNTTAIFGAGIIDSIPADVIEAVAAAQALQKRGEEAAEAVPALQQAINDREAGVADESRNRFMRLSAGEQLLLTTYLKTLGVP